MKRKLLKLISLTLVTILLLSLSAPFVTANSAFPDVPANHPAVNAINWANHNGIVTGNNGLFLPEDNMTRASYALILYRYEGRPAVSSTGGFSDVPASHVAHTAITWANANGIVTGAGDRFLPEDNMTRAQMVLMMHRYNNLKGRNNTSSSTALDSFSDRGSVPAAAQEAMRWAVTHGMITGNAGRLMPNDPVTRAQVVLILFRYVNAFVGPTASVPPVTTPPPSTTPVQFAPITISGRGNSVTNVIKIPADYTIANLKHDGRSNFYIWVYDGSHELISLLVNTIGVYSGSSLLDVSRTNRDIILEVTADGNWTIEIVPFKAADTAAFSGSGDMVSGLFRAPASGTWIFTHDGRRNFIVWVYTSSGMRLAANEIGTYNGEKIINFGNDVAFWTVEADGNWTIRPR